MERLLYLGLVALVFLSGCMKTTDSLSKKRSDLQTRIGQEEQVRIDEAAGSAEATRHLLGLYKGDDPLVAAAQETNTVTIHALPNPSLETRLKWDIITAELVADHEKAPRILRDVKKKLVDSEKKEAKLRGGLAKTTESLIGLHTSKQVEREIEKALKNHELQKYLVKVFAFASVASVLISAAISWFFSWRMGVYGFVAAGVFGFAAYYVTQTWFAYLAAALAIVILVGILLFIMGRSKPEKELRGQVHAINTLGDSENEEEKKAAKIVKRRINDIQKTKRERDRHEKYIKYLEEV